MECVGREHKQQVDQVLVGWGLNLYRQLIDVNSKLWDIEDELRTIETTKNFDTHFIELARKVYYTNDDRFLLKNQINELTDSEVREQKDYIEYK